MSSGWEIYSVFILAAIFALTCPLVLFLLSRLFRRRRSPRILQKERAGGNQALASANPVPRDFQVNTRYFLSINVATVLIGLCLILFPCASAIRSLSQVVETDAEGRHLLVLCLATILSVTLFLFLSLFYATKKGDMSWLRTSQGTRRGERP